MTAAVIVLAASPAFVALAVLVAARAGVVSLHVRRPPRPRAPKTETTP